MTEKEQIGEKIIQFLHRFTGICAVCGDAKCTHVKATILPKMIRSDIVLEAILSVTKG